MLSKYFFRLVPVQVAVDVPRQIGAQPLKQQQLMDIVFLVTTRQQDWLVIFHDQHSQRQDFPAVAKTKPLCVFPEPAFQMTAILSLFGYVRPIISILDSFLSRTLFFCNI